MWALTKTMVKAADARIRSPVRSSNFNRCIFPLTNESTCECDVFLAKK